MTRRVPLLARTSVVVALVGLLAGCGGIDAATDCSAAVKYQGRVYEEVAYTYEVDVEVGSGQQAWCDDVGRDARGNVFDGASLKVPVFSLPGFDTSQVVLMRASDDLYRVMVGDDVSKTDRTVILQSEVVNGDELD